MNRYSFFYDESEHSRKINHKTITAENYCDSFTTVIVGWLSDNQTSVYDKYAAFESKYHHRQSKGELKSTTIGLSQLKSGFASLNADNVSLLEDFLALFNDKILVYYAVTSKIEYIVHQIFEGYRNNIFVDMDAMKYSITKAIVVYQPRDIIDGMYQTTGELVALFRNFFKAQIEKDKANISLKQKEIEQFDQILLLLDDVSTINNIDWNYDFAFIGFKSFLAEKGIGKYSLTIDKEGEDGNTLKAAVRVGLNDVSEADSLSSSGIRMADMLAGIISKLIKALHGALEHVPSDEAINKRILDKSWFTVNKRQLALYKQMHHVAIELNKSWYKAFSGIYSDDLTVLISLLNFMNHFESVDEINRNLDMQGEFFNAYCCESLANYFLRMRSKLPIVPVNDRSSDSFIDRHGAKVYFDTSRQPKLEIEDGQRICDVLSAGLSKELIPMITVVEGNEAKCYRLPLELSEWAMMLVRFANSGENLFPSRVMFSKTKDGYFASILEGITH